MSVSRHPEAWTRIARLGGRPTWNLKKPGARFLDFHALTETERADPAAWGIDHGYLEMRQQWKWTRRDDELGCEVWSLRDSRDEVIGEAYMDEGDELDDNCAQVTAVEVPCPTAAVAARLAFATGVTNALEIVATFWVEDATTLDGVWGDDVLDVAGYSAPRGVIVGLRCCDSRLATQPRTS